MATRKISGGDINLNRVFRRILSIGFEYETGFLSKMTLVDDYDEEGNPIKILLNTDTARDNIADLESTTLDESDPFYEDYVLRQNETMELPLLDDAGKHDTNSKFHVTNDIASSPFLKYLEQYCSNDIPKNQQYKFVTKTGEDYNIHFSYWNEKTDCSVFADVEWVFTYYKPKISSNIILNCFFNSIKNLSDHLQDMEPVEGHLEMTVGDESFPVGKPITRQLYKSRKDNLYYLQVHHYNGKFTLDDVCLTMQMTFSTHISNAFSVMKGLLMDNIRSVPEQTQLSEERFKIMKKIEMCGERLFKTYNAKNERKITIKKNTMQYREMENYINLILFKLYVYYNIHLPVNKKDRGYFKNSMFFNPRHTNVVFYEALKELLMNTMKWSEEETVDVIRKLFVQEEVLVKDLLENPAHIRKNGFNIDNRVEKTATKYGDPYYSLISYFEFFESPSDNENNKTAEGEYAYYDYLEYADIDALSNKFDYNNKIILIEMRSFPRLITSYLKKIATPEVRKMMENSICKKFRPNFVGEFTSHPMSNLVKFAEIYRQMDQRSPSRESKRLQKIVRNKTMRVKTALKKASTQKLK